MLKRLMAILAVTVFFTGGAVAVAQRSAQAIPPPVQGCQEKASMSSYNRPYWETFVNNEGTRLDFWRSGPFRISDGCVQGTITWEGHGNQFEESECHYVRAHYQRDNGSWWYYYPSTGWFIDCGNGNPLILQYNAPVNRRVVFESMAVNANDRQYWSLFRVRF